MYLLYATSLFILSPFHNIKSHKTTGLQASKMLMNVNVGGLHSSDANCLGLLSFSINEFLKQVQKYQAVSRTQACRN